MEERERVLYVNASVMGLESELEHRPVAPRLQPITQV